MAAPRSFLPSDVMDTFVPRKMPWASSSFSSFTTSHVFAAFGKYPYSAGPLSYIIRTYGRSAIDIALFCSMVRLACQLSVVNYGTPASLAMDQVTRTPKRRSDGRSSFCGPAKRLKLTAVPLKRRSDCAKASAYGNMTPYLK